MAARLSASPACEVGGRERSGRPVDEVLTGQPDLQCVVPVDLIVGDTYGKVRYYRNLTGGVNPEFAAPIVIADVKTRLVPAIADWNGDGKPDLLVGDFVPGQPGGPREYHGWVWVYLRKSPQLSLSR